MYTQIDGGVIGENTTLEFLFFKGSSDISYVVYFTYFSHMDRHSGGSRSFLQNCWTFRFNLVNVSEKYDIKDVSYKTLRNHW